MDRIPASMVMMASTQAKTGRSMKNEPSDLPLFCCGFRCPGLGLYSRAGADFLVTGHDDGLTGLDTGRYDPLILPGLASLNRTRISLPPHQRPTPSRCHLPDGSLPVGAGVRLRAYLNQLPLCVGSRHQHGIGIGKLARKTRHLLQRPRWPDKHDLAGMGIGCFVIA